MNKGLESAIRTILLNALLVLPVLLVAIVLADGAEIEQIVMSQYKVEDKPIFDCLWILAREAAATDQAAPVIVLESVEPVFEFATAREGLATIMAIRANSFYERISYSAENASVAQIMNRLTTEDPKFTWNYDSRYNVINVTERQLIGNPLWYLNKQVKGAVVHAGEGIEALARIAKENSIAYSGPSEGDSKWRESKDFTVEQTCGTTDFRSVLNCVLSQVAPPKDRFYMITCMQESKGDFDAEWAANARGRLWGPFPNGFDFLYDSKSPRE